MYNTDDPIALTKEALADEQYCMSGEYFKKLSSNLGTMLKSPPKQVYAWNGLMKVKDQYPQLRHKDYPTLWDICGEMAVDNNHPMWRFITK